MPLLCLAYTLIHSLPLPASLLATMLRAQSSSVRGDSRSHRLRLLLLIVVSVMTCAAREAAAANKNTNAARSHHAGAGLVKVIE